MKVVRMVMVMSIAAGGADVDEAGDHTNTIQCPYLIQQAPEKSK